MPKTALLIAPALAASALLAPAALAHHSMERFDASQTVTVQGVVTEFEWANPHVYIYLDQTSDGETTSWQVEGFPPSILRRQGWTRDMLNVGDTLSVTGNPSKIEENATMFLTSMEHAAETFDTMTGIMALTSAGDVEVAPAPVNLNGSWTTLLNLSLVSGFGEERLQLTEAGAAAKEAFDETTMHPGAQCIPFPPPLMMFSPDVKQILSNDEVMLIGSEFDGAVRTIHLDQDSHEGAPRSVLGHSIGHWEGDTLVIDTTNFADHALGADFGVPSGAEKHLVERLTINEDGTSLTYAFEFTDPEFFTATVSDEVQWVYTPEETFAPPPCDPENARRFIND